MNKYFALEREALGISRERVMGGINKLFTKSMKRNLN